MSEPTPDMAPWEALMKYAGEGSIDEDFIKDCWATATALVDRYVGIECTDQCPQFPHLGFGHGSFGSGPYGGSRVPKAVLMNAYLQTGSELYERRHAPSGITSFDDGTVSPVRLARDPLTSVYPLLSRFVGGRFA